MLPRPRELRRPKPTERGLPLAEVNDPLALERCYADAPEGWDEATLTAAVEMQRAEREARLDAKARKRTPKMDMQHAVKATRDPKDTKRTEMVTLDPKDTPRTAMVTPDSLPDISRPAKATADSEDTKRTEMVTVDSPSL